MKYNIINVRVSSKIKEDFIMGQTDSLEKAKKMVRDMKKTDKILQKYYKWVDVPIYKIEKCSSNLNCCRLCKHCKNYMGTIKENANNTNI